MKFVAALAIFLLGLTLALAQTTNNGALVGTASSTLVAGTAVSTSAVTDITKTTTITQTASAGLSFAQPTVMITLVPTTVPTMLPTVTPVAYIDYDYEDTSAASGLAPFSFF
jgi:hypothetical protein